MTFGQWLLIELAVCALCAACVWLGHPTADGTVRSNGDGTHSVYACERYYTPTLFGWHRIDKVCQWVKEGG